MTKNLPQKQSKLPPKAELKPLDAEASQAFVLSEFMNLGRASENPIQICDDFVSARHARIELKENSFWLKDLRSRNGTFLNGSRIQEALLKDGDRIRIGHSTFQFCLSELGKASNFESDSKNTNWNKQLLALPNIAQSEFSVLILGPSGSGKELIARRIHELSSRAQGPFVTVNCSAFSESLIESELFGHTKGSFTGATENRKGAFEAARSGSLFLDEIGDLPPNLQPKLLRTLENQEIRPVGSDFTKQTDVRIIAATHHDLRQKVADGQFRADLYFRLNVARIHSPGLKERMEDFDRLLYYFAKLYRVRFSLGCINKLKEHSWPGNIRELKNFVARCKTHFPEVQIEEDMLTELLDVAPVASYAINSTGPVMKELERRLIEQRLQANRGNQKLTANDLGMPRSTLNDRIRNYGIDVNLFR